MRILIYLLLSFTAMAHEPNEAFFKITQNDSSAYKYHTKALNTAKKKGIKRNSSTTYFI